MEGPCFFVSRLCGPFRPSNPLGYSAGPDLASDPAQGNDEVPEVEDEAMVRARTRVGSVLDGKYRLDRVLGVGGMASVYEATHRNSKRFAVKMLHPELSLRTDIRTRFLREGYVANQVQHPGAVAVHDDDIAEDGSAFIVMELLVGTTVEELWEKHRHRLPLAAVLAIAHQLLDVLAAAHERGIVHRDIKPANLFLTTEGQIKVLDFGIARLKDVANSSATSTGMVMGTPAFMSPEQALGTLSEVDAQSDIWAAGAVLYTLASGHYIHEGESAQHIIVKTATTPAASFATVLPEAHREVVRLIDGALAFEKGHRWPSAIAMRDRLNAAAHVALGIEPSRSALVELFSGGRAAETSASLELGEERVRVAGINSSLSEERTQIHVPDARTVSTDVRHPGLVTEQPVFRDGSGKTSRAHRRLWLAATGLGLLALITTAVRGLTGSDHASATASSAATSTPSAPTSTASLPAATLRPLDVPPTITFEDLPQADSLLAPAATATAPSRAAATGASCSPPYTVNPATGKKHFKVECL